MTRRSLRPIAACLGVAAICLLNASESTAQRVPPIEKFDGMAMNTAGPTPEKAGRIEIALERWSSEAQGEKLGAALATGADKLLGALKTVGSPIGVIISPGIQGAGARARERRQQSILYARDIKTATGRQVIVATDEHLGFGEVGKERVRSEKNELTVIDIRFGADGKGVGRIALVDHVTYNQQTKSIEVAGFDTLPAGVVDVTATKK
jgi:hypothetical protein